MKTIKEIFENLDESDRSQLLYGFEHEFAQYVCLPGNEFIGVNVGNIKHLEILQQTGAWSIGKIKGNAPSCNL